jgi:acyl-CoA thioester hydrolase
MKELSVYPVIYDQKVAWGDMDAFGHVNNVQYYRYIESSRILYMENVNILIQIYILLLLQVSANI